MAALTPIPYSASVIPPVEDNMLAITDHNPILISFYLLDNLQDKLDMMLS